jgi:hypothetical protein
MSIKCQGTAALNLVSALLAPPLSKRGKEWNNFSRIVARHIEGYTVPQYGDAPDDQASKFSEQDIIANIRRYVNRMESNARGPEEAQRDLLKIAHYCAMLYFKRQSSRAAAWSGSIPPPARS